MTYVIICCQSGRSIETISVKFNVVGMPTDSAAVKAIVKFRRFSACFSVEYGILSGMYVCRRAQNAIPSFQELLKFVISTSTYPVVLDWHHFSRALRLLPPFLTKADNGSHPPPVVTKTDGVSYMRRWRLTADLLDNIETGDADVSASAVVNGDAFVDPLVDGLSLICVGVDGVNTGLLGCSEIGDSVGMVGVLELRL